MNKQEKTTIHYAAVLEFANHESYNESRFASVFRAPADYCFP